MLIFGLLRWSLSFFCLRSMRRFNLSWALRFLSISRWRLANVFWFFAMVVLLNQLTLSDSTDWVTGRQTGNFFLIRNWPASRAVGDFANGGALAAWVEFCFFLPLQTARRWSPVHVLDLR